MTEQEQKAFDQMREALELHMAEYSKAWKPGMEILEPIGDAALTAANAVSHPQATEPQAQGDAKTYEPSRQRVIMACDILDRIKEAHENWGGWSGTPSSCDAAINLLRYPANMPVNAAHLQATEPAGWKLVPVEPTQEMLDAVVTTLDDHLLGPDAEKQYREDWAAMLAAAPEAHHGK